MAGNHLKLFAVCSILLCLSGCGRSGSGTHQSAAVTFPLFPSSPLYADARKQLTDAGWSPVTQPNAQKCDNGDARCENYPEMLSCAGAGNAACQFTWKNGDTVIDVVAVGEGGQTVDTVRCVSGCPPEAIVAAGFENTVFLSGDYMNSDNQYCEVPNDVYQSLANFSVRSNNDATPYVTAVPVQMTLHDAIFAVAHLTYASTQNGMMGRDLTCYAYDPQRDRYYPGAGFVVGSMKVTAIQFVNEFSAQGPIGPTRARSYHVSYEIKRPSGATQIRGIDGVVFTETCILSYDNAENRWAFAKCTPTNAGN